MAGENELIILDGCTFFYSDENGDVEAQEAEGALANDQGQVEHEQQELRQQRRALRHRHHEWSED